VHPEPESLAGVSLSLLVGKLLCQSALAGIAEKSVKLSKTG
jgi:hypothetical protein